MTPRAVSSPTMIHALGFSHTEFDAARPGRLCRGRERWIEPFELDTPSPMYRTVVSGAVFEDDSARDALRGVQHSRVDPARVITSLVREGTTLLAFMEDGHPADIPEEAESVEAYVVYRNGGATQEPAVRWRMTVAGYAEVSALLGPDPDADRVRGFAVVHEGTDLEALAETLFLLTGMATLDSPPARFQPSALPEVLELTEAVILIHRDKNGPAIGMYSTETIDVRGCLAEICTGSEPLGVSFAIPPMLARWDRALAEARSEWMSTRDDEFPVPPAPEPSGWTQRNRRRGRGRRAAPVEE